MPANLQGMTPEARTAIGIALDELRKAGIQFNVTSGYRSPEKQQELWNNRATNPFRVAPPGSSGHEKGLAADITFADESQRPAANAILSKHGFQWFGTKDRVHYDFKPGAFGATAADLTPPPADNFFNPPRKKTPPSSDAFFSTPTGGAKAPPPSDTFFSATKPAPKKSASPPPSDAFFTPAQAASSSSRAAALAGAAALGQGHRQITGTGIKLRETTAPGNVEALQAAGIPTEPGFAQAGATMQGAGVGLNRVTATLFPLREVANSVMREQTKADLKARAENRNKTPAEDLTAFWQGVWKSHPWTALKQGLGEGKPTDLKMFAERAAADPVFRKNINMIGGPHVWDFIASFPIDWVSGGLQEKILGGLQKAVTPAAHAIQAAAEAKIPALGRAASGRRAYRAAQDIFNLKGAQAEKYGREAADIAQDVQTTSRKYRKAGAPIRVKDPLTGRTVNEFDRLVADYIEAGSPGSRHEIPPPTSAEILQPILGQVRGHAGEIAAAEAARQQQVLAPILGQAATKGRTAAAEAVAAPERVLAGLREAGRTKGRAAIAAVLEPTPVPESIFARAREHVQGILKESDIQRLAEQAARSQYNEFTNVIEQAGLSPHQLNSMLAEMKAAGRDAVMGLFRQGMEADADLLAKAGAGGRAKVRQIMAQRAAEDAAHAALLKRLTPGARRGLAEAVSKPNEALSAVLGRAKAKGMAAAGEGTAAADVVLGKATGPAGRERVQGLIQGTSPTEQGMRVTAFRDPALARRADELTKVAGEAKNLGVDYADVQRIGEKYRGLADKLGQDLVNSGRLTPEAYEKLRGLYLPRLYALRASSPADAEKFLQSLEAQGVIGAEEARNVRQALASPRQTGSPDFGSHREITEFGERVSPQLGRLAEGSATPAMTRYTGKASKAIAESQAMQEIAKNPALARPRYGGQPAPPDWVPFKNPINGEEHVIHPGVARYLAMRENPSMSFAEVIRRVPGGEPYARAYQNTMGAMKRIWVSSPKTAVNNAVGNYQLGKSAAELNGASYSLAGYAATVKDIRAWRTARKIANPYLDEAINQTDLLAERGGLIPQEAKAIGSGFGVETPLQRAGQVPGKAFEGYSNIAYRDPEQAGRFYLYQQLRKSGKGIDEAARITRAAMVDYTDIGPFRRLAEQNNILPFVTFPTKAIFQYANLAARRPDLFNTFTGERFRVLADQMADAAAGRAGHVGHAREKRILGETAPADFPVPGKFDVTGQQVYARLPALASIFQGIGQNPGGDIAGSVTERLKGAVPMVDVALSLLRNQSYNAMTDTTNPIVAPGSVPPGGTLGGPLGGLEVPTEYAKFVLKRFVPQAGDVERIVNAARGTSPFASPTTSVPRLKGAILQSIFGIRVGAELGENKAERGIRTARHVIAAGAMPESEYGKFATDYMTHMFDQWGADPKWRPDRDMQNFADATYNDPGKLKEALDNAQKKLNDVLGSKKYTGMEKKTAIRRLMSWVFILSLRSGEVGQEQQKMIQPGVTPESILGGAAP